MAMAGVMQAQMDNFQVIASADALKVLAEDPYFQDLAPHWHEIIGKIQNKLTPKEQNARFSEQLSSLADESPEYDEVRAALPDAIKHLIAALDSSGKASQHSSVTGVELKLEFERTYRPSTALNSKMPRQQPTAKTCREEERPEERSRHRLVPNLVS
ncbi:MAG: hypothetical protein JSR17_13105 [Proteobacteria bacterium]|nr:hypothetical protein [Pseudomonadota bacterium]